MDTISKITLGRHQILQHLGVDILWEVLDMQMLQAWYNRPRQHRPEPQSQRLRVAGEVHYFSVQDLPVISFFVAVWQIFCQCTCQPIHLKRQLWRPLETFAGFESATPATRLKGGFSHL